MRMCGELSPSYRRPVEISLFLIADRNRKQRCLSALTFALRKCNHLYDPILLLARAHLSLHPRPLMIPETLLITKYFHTHERNLLYTMKIK